MKTGKIKIGRRWVGRNCPVFIIAEAGVNHNGKIKVARRLIDVAVASQADAVKFQTYNTERIITTSALGARYHLRAVGRKKSWFRLLKELELNKEEHKYLQAYCKKKGIIFLSTPYDEESADFLQELDVPAFKVASTDSNNIPLLKHIAGFGKPILLSTGLSTLKEVKESLGAIKKAGNQEVILLQCTANYPPDLNDANLNAIGTLEKECSCLAGYSDHFGLPEVAIAAVAKGACVYEVHFTLDRAMPGPDQQNSLEPDGLKEIIQRVRLTEKLLGCALKKVTPSEKETRLRLRKSILAASGIKKGDTFTKENLAIKRPGTGLAPKYLAKFLGKSAYRNIAKDQLMCFKDIK